jgi:cyclopropane-fatty-acyl-phospholipid synthase
MKRDRARRPLPRLPPASDLASKPLWQSFFKSCCTSPKISYYVASFPTTIRGPIGAHEDWTSSKVNSLMATQSQIGETYNYMDEFFRATYGQHADCTAAMYNGSHSQTLEQAQHAKHEYILTQLGIAAGHRVLDVGCGWGPVLHSLKDHGAEGVGITLSTKQADACRKNGLNAHIADWKHLDASKLGTFDGIVSVGAFEHFCSKEEFLEGRQPEIYRRFFTFCHSLLRAGGRFYLQTMTWGRNAPSVAEISLQGPKSSNPYIVALAEKFYPGSWLPRDEAQITESACPYFRVVASNSGRLDYMRTIQHWNQRLKVTKSNSVALFRTLRYLLIDRNLRFKLMSLSRGCQYQCFEREIMDHRRIVLEKIATSGS